MRLTERVANIIIASSMKNKICSSMILMLLATSTSLRFHNHIIGRDIDILFFSLVMRVFPANLCAYSPFDLPFFSLSHSYWNSPLGEPRSSHSLQPLFICSSEDPLIPESLLASIDFNSLPNIIYWFIQEVRNRLYFCYAPSSGTVTRERECRKWRDRGHYFYVSRKEDGGRNDRYLHCSRLLDSRRLRRDCTHSQGEKTIANSSTLVFLKASILKVGAKTPSFSLLTCHL